MKINGVPVYRAFCTECTRSHHVPIEEWNSPGENRCECGGLLEKLIRQKRRK